MSINASKRHSEALSSAPLGIEPPTYSSTAEPGFAFY